MISIDFSTIETAIILVLTGIIVIVVGYMITKNRLEKRCLGIMFVCVAFIVLISIVPTSEKISDVEFVLGNIQVTDKIEVSCYNGPKYAIADTGKFVILPIEIHNNTDDWISIIDVDLTTSIDNEYSFIFLYIEAGNDLIRVREITSISEEECSYNEKVPPKSGKKFQYVFNIAKNEIPMKLYMTYGFCTNELSAPKRYEINKEFDL